MRKFFSAILIATFLFVGVNEILVYASEGINVSDEGTVIDPAVLEATTQRFFSAVETYRDDAGQFLIAQQTYYQLNTLASQDEAIRRAKNVMLSRAELLNIYFTYLHLSVLQVRGVELSDKEMTLNQISSILSELSIYKDQIPEVSTRAEANSHLIKFNERRGGFLSAAYASLELIKIGQTQTAIDTAAILRRDMETMVNEAPISAADRAIKLRGLSEASSLLQTSSADLNKILLQHRQLVAQGSLSEQNYRSFQTELEPVYIQLRQSEAFMKEVAKGL